MAATEKKDDGALKMKDPGQLSYSDALDHAQKMQQQNQGQSSDALIYSDRVTPDICQKVKTISSKIGVQPNDLMACMCFETGGEFKAKLYPSSNAVGLIQFTQAAVDELNLRDKIAPTAKTSKTALAAMSEIDQLDYVEKYFMIQKEIYKRSMSNLADLYMAIFCPAGVGKSDNYALYKRGTKAYSQNSGLDANKDGIITKAEAASKPMQKLEEGLQELEDRNAPEIGSGTIKLKSDPNLRIRSGATKSSQTIGRIPNGAQFSYIKEQNGWLRIRYNGKIGWISKQYTSLYGTAPAATTTTTQDQTNPTNETTTQPTVAVEEPKVDAPAQNALDDGKQKDAMAWYSTKKFTPELITDIQNFVHVTPTGTINAETVQAVGAWQKSVGLTGNDVDGKFGKTAAGKCGDKALEAKIVALLGSKTTTTTSNNASKPVTGSKEVADFLRSNYKDGFNVCFRYKKTNGNNSEFKTQADQYCKEYNTVAIENGELKVKAYTVMSNKDALINDINNITESVRNCLAANPQEGFDDSKCAQIKNLAFMCHGCLNWDGKKETGSLDLGGGSLSETELKDFVKSIRGSLADDIRVQLYACNCARNQRQGSHTKENDQQKEGDWYHRGAYNNITEKDNYANGDNSFADILAEELGGDASVYGHTTRGTATKNHAARVFGKDANYAQHGVSTFDIYFPQAFVASEAVRLNKDETKVRTEMYKYYRVNFEKINAGRGSFIDPEGFGKTLRDGWSSANP